MEKEIEAPPLDHEIERSLLATEPAAAPGNGSVKGVLWVRLIALCFGWFMLFGGLGIVGGFSLVMDRDMQDIWAVGFIPAMAGIGLLLFYYLSRNYGASFARLDEKG